VSNEPEQSAHVVALVLDGLGSARDLDELVVELRVMHRDESNFPATPLLELAADDAYIAGGRSRDDRLVIDGLDRRLLPEWPARGNAGHQKRRHCIHSAIMITAGAEPEDTSWWSTDDLWLQALHAVIIFTRATAERRRVSIADVCNQLRQGR
jgi:hypothetical protein